MKKFPFQFKVNAQADNAAPAEISIRGVIGTSFDYATWTEKNTEDEVLNELNKIPAGKKINVRINSVGGEVGIALGIFNALKRRGDDVTTYNEGYACSSASVLMLAGARRISPTASIWMIHRASGGAYGTDEDMTAAADMMKAHNQTLCDIYAKATGKKPEDIQAMMKKETWFTGTEAKALGFADEESGEITDDKEAIENEASRKVLAGYKIPENLRSRLIVTASADNLPPKQTNNPTPKKDMKQIINALVAAGFTIPADAEEGLILPHINALISERANLRTENKAFADARDARVTALVETAVTDKIVAESRKAGLIALGKTNEAEVVAQIGELRAAKVVPAARGAKPGKFVAEGASEDEVAARLGEIETEMGNRNISAAARAILAREALSLRGLNNLVKPIESTKAQ